MNILDKAEIKDIQSLISNGNSLRFRINFYQRPYRWTAKKVTDLFDDYKENRVSAGDRQNDREYFLGAVVLVDERNQDEKKSGIVWKYQVVDGQQRFTTLFLLNYIKFLLLIRRIDYAVTRNNLNDLNSATKEAEICYGGFIGSVNLQNIIDANNELYSDLSKALEKKIDLDSKDLDSWRKKVGWIENPNHGDSDYYDKCCEALKSFIEKENLCISYENPAFNSYLKEALSRIIFKFSEKDDAEIYDEALVEEYDENDETSIEFPYVSRAYGIFEQIKKMNGEINPNKKTPYEKLCAYIDIINEMLKNIKLCMIVTSEEDDAYKLFETLNDRSESVNDLELLKNYFFKTYSEKSGDAQNLILKNISELDRRWRNIFFTYDELESEIFEYMTVLFTGDTAKNTNEKRRKLIKKYLSTYDKYTFDIVNRDFEFMEYIQEILIKIHRLDNSKLCKIKNEDDQLSLYIENDLKSSAVKRAIGLAINLSYGVVAGSIISDVIHNYNCNGKKDFSNFSLYLDCVFNNKDCIQKYPGLWNDASVIWNAIVLSKNYDSPKKLSDVLANMFNVKQMSTPRDVNKQWAKFDANILDKDTLKEEFDKWIVSWKFSEGDGKLKIKNLFMHMHVKYQLDKVNDQLVTGNPTANIYEEDAIKQDLDHMDACKVDIQGKKFHREQYYHYNQSDRTIETNGLGNMMPLPVKINRGKHNTPMEVTIDQYPGERLVGWIFDMAKDLFVQYHDDIMIQNQPYKIPTKDFFEERKKRLIDYFKRIVDNNIINPKPRI